MAGLLPEDKKFLFPVFLGTVVQKPREFGIFDRSLIAHCKSSGCVRNAQRVLEAIGTQILFELSAQFRRIFSVHNLPSFSGT